MWRQRWRCNGDGNDVDGPGGDVGCGDVGGDGGCSDGGAQGNHCGSDEGGGSGRLVAVINVVHVVVTTRACANSHILYTEQHTVLKSACQSVYFARPRRAAFFYKMTL